MVETIVKYLILNKETKIRFTHEVGKGITDVTLLHRNSEFPVGKTDRKVLEKWFNQLFID